MDSNESGVAETDAHILTFDIPDDALERAAGAAHDLGTSHFPLARLHLALIAKLEAPTFDDTD